jgi:hypothetical protein
MARATVGSGRGGRKLKPSLNSNLRKFARAVPGIVGASIVEGIGGPKAKVAGRVVKTSAKLASAIAREAAGDKAKGMTVRKVPLYKLDKAKVTVKTGSSTTVKKGTSAQNVPKTKSQVAERNKVVIKKMTAAEKTAAKAASKARKEAPASRREATKPNTVGVKKYTPRASKTVRRARSVNELGKSTASRTEKKIAAKKERKLEARKNRANRPSVIARNKAVVKKVGEQKQAEKRRQLNETRLLNDKTPVTQYDKNGRVIGTTTKGELLQLKIKVDRAQTNPRLEPFVRGVRPQRTIDDRSPRPQGLTDKEIEILRKVGKRDYSRGEVNPLAQRIVQSEADKRVGVFFKDPRVTAQDKARETAAIRKTMKDAKTSRSIKNMRKNYRGKPMN